MMKDDDFKLFRGFEDRQTNGQTLVIVESLLRLKNYANFDIILLKSVKIIASLEF